MSKLFQVFCLLMVGSVAIASTQPFTPDGTYTIRVQANHHTRKRTRSKANAAPTVSEFQVEKIKVSPEARKLLVVHIKAALSDKPANGDEKPEQTSEKIFLGMEGVPVFNQGDWMTCSTFAVTAGIDAYLKLKESAQISQLCNLSLGMYLSTSNYYGGWNYSDPSQILSQISVYGYLTNRYQRSQGCGGIKEYPISSDFVGEGITAFDFSLSAKHRFRGSDWQQLLMSPINLSDLKSRFDSSDVILKQIKAALRRGHRVVIAMHIIPGAHNGTIGSYHGDNDVWGLSDDMLDKLSDSNQTLGGHSLLITGFDDGCIDVTYNDSIDLNGQEPPPICGYVVVRNSWGSDVGDQGDYYISYDYLGVFMDEAYEIG